MWSGGQTLSPADAKAKVEDLRKQQDELRPELQELDREQGELVSQRDNVTQPAHENASGDYNDAARESSRKEGDKNVLEGQTRTAEQEERNAREAVDQFGHDISQSWKRLDPSRAAAENAWQMARFFEKHYRREYFDDVIQAQLEAICENRNAGGKALVAFHAACVNMAAAMLGLSKNLSSQLEHASYITIKGPKENRAPEQYANAQQQSDNLKASEDEIRERAQDPHYAQKLSEVQARRAGLEQKHSAAKAQHAAAERREDAAKKARDKAAEEYRQAAQVVRDKAEEVGKVQNELQDLRRQEERTINDQQNKQAANANRAPAQGQQQPQPGGRPVQQPQNTPPTDVNPFYNGPRK
ncbi:MAG: hypothetical protein ABH871_03385 [Pseudomonadota bacterium]